jgi:hypothetical protein
MPARRSSSLRREAEERGKLIKAASERHAPPNEACKLIGNFGQSTVEPDQQRHFDGNLYVICTDTGTTFTSLLPPGSPTNVLNVAGTLDNTVTNGGTLQAGLQNLYDGRSLT